jgi:hypothetical protein
VARSIGKTEFDLQGFLLKKSKDFILLQQEKDFTFDGYAIIPKTRFYAIRFSKKEKTFNNILVKEGIFEKEYGIKNEIDLSDWQTIFYELKKLDYHVIVECENLKKPLFLIGPIESIEKKSLYIRYYDAKGLLDKKATKVKYQDITILRFDERYTNVFRKYLRERKK